MLICARVWYDGIPLYQGISFGRSSAIIETIAIYLLSQSQFCSGKIIDYVLRRFEKGD